MSTEEANPYSSRAESLEGRAPELIANVHLYSTSDGGKLYPAFPGWGCICVTGTQLPTVGFDGWPLLDEPIRPGEERKKVGFVFLSPEAASALARSREFYLWEGKLVGEACVVG